MRTREHCSTAEGELFRQRLMEGCQLFFIITIMLALFSQLNELERPGVASAARRRVLETARLEALFSS
jgi:hypothetical protein